MCGGACAFPRHLRLESRGDGAASGLPGFQPDYNHTEVGAIRLQVVTTEDGRATSYCATLADVRASRGITVDDLAAALLVDAVPSVVRTGGFSSDKCT